MKLFWMIYVPLTLAALVFLSINLQNPRIIVMLVTGVFLAAIWLFVQRHSIGRQRHHGLLAVLAAFSSIAAGFICILAVVLLGNVGALNFLER